MERHLGRRQLEDQPSVAHVDEIELQDVADEGTVGVRVAAVQKHVRAVDHRNLLCRSYRSRRAYATSAIPTETSENADSATTSATWSGAPPIIPNGSK